MTTIKSKTVLKNISKDDADKAMATYSQATTEIKKLDNDVKKKVTELEAKVAGQKNILAEVAAKAYDILEAYAQANPELFEGKKSINLSGGIVGYRSGTDKVKEKEGFTMDTIITKLEKYLPDFLKVKKELNRAVINSKLDDKTIVKQLEKCGLEIEPGQESFYVKVA